MSRLGRDAVDVWYVRLAAVPVSRAHETLSEAELARAERFRFAADRRQFIASHVATRHILACYAAVPPARIELDAEPSGKPSLARLSDLRFNLSHAGGRALVAVALRSEVGVDLERIRPLDVDELALVALSAAEQHTLASYKDNARVQAFLRLWTLKEAVIKARGVGLAADPAAVDVGRALRKGATGGWVSVDGMWARELELGGGYVGALAICEKPHAVELRRWPPTSSRGDGVGCRASKATVNTERCDR